VPKGRLLDPNRKARQRLTASKHQEEATAERLGGKRTPGSGNQWHSKNDVKSKEWLVENKTTEKERYSLKISDLRSLLMNAILEEKKPVMEVEFRGKLKESFVIMPLWAAKELGYAAD
jgi:hypothetical protein